MSWTIGLWLVAWPVVAFAAIAMIGVVFLLFTSLLGLAYQLRVDRAEHAPWFPMGFELGWALITNLTTLLFTFLVVLDTSLRFDRIAGRMAGGTVATTVDAMVHGRARQAVFLPDKNVARKPKALVTPPGVE